MNKTHVKIEELQETVYVPPQIFVVNIVVEQTVLGGGSLGDLSGEVW